MPLKEMIFAKAKDSSLTNRQKLVRTRKTLSWQEQNAPE